jgi:hypothetical protein
LVQVEDGRSTTPTTGIVGGHPAGPGGNFRKNEAELIDVGVMGTQHGEVISLSDWNPGFLELHLDSGRCSPDSERQDVTPVIAAPDL